MFKHIYLIRFVCFVYIWKANKFFKKLAKIVVNLRYSKQSVSVARPVRWPAMIRAFF
jgi:hypothetical protein